MRHIFKTIKQIGNFITTLIFCLLSAMLVQEIILHYRPELVPCVRLGHKMGSLVPKQRGLVINLSRTIPSVHRPIMLAPPHDLVSRLSDYTSLFPFPETSTVQYNAYQTWNEEKMYNLTYQLTQSGLPEIEGSEDIDDRVLRLYMPILDSLIFRGSLNQVFRPRYQTPLIISNALLQQLGTENAVVVGLMQPLEFATRKALVHFRPSPFVLDILTRQGIIPKNADDLEVKVHILRSRIGTLLHEMVHLFFWKYRNFPSTVEERDWCLGKGHGKCWVEASRAVEDFVREKLGLWVDLGIGSSASSES